MIGSYNPPLEPYTVRLFDSAGLDGGYNDDGTHADNLIAEHLFSSKEFAQEYLDAYAKVARELLNPEDAEYVIRASYKEPYVMPEIRFAFDADELSKLI